MTSRSNLTRYAQKRAQKDAMVEVRLDNGNVVLLKRTLLEGVHEKGTFKTRRRKAAIKDALQS